MIKLTNLEWKSTVIVLCLLFVISFKVHSQNQNDYLPKVILPSPTQAALLKFEEIPVSLYTGVPEISIPFYTIKSKNVVLPINLSYHGSGVKVNEVSPWTGQGWSLNAGGAISRLVRGAADDRTLYGYRSRNIVDGYLTYGKFTKYPTADNAQLWNEANGNYDSEPDLFFFNFLNFSGKFIFRLKHDDTPEIVILSGEALKISYTLTDGRISSFVVITPDGLRFLFSDVEMNTIGSRTSGSNDPIGTTDSYSTSQYNSSWLLTKISSPNDVLLVKFDYTEVTEKYSGDQTQSKFYKDSAYDWPCSVINKTDYVQNTTTDMVFSTKKISKISFREGSLEFGLSNSDRLDLDNSGRILENIVIKDYNGSIKTRYNFVYSYSGDPTNLDYSARRLYLDKIIQQNKDQTQELKPYLFSYKMRDSLPNRHSYAIDYWGYYNSKILNTEFTPSLPEFNSSGANREPDTSASYGSLKNITYPTGGSTSFNYELNDYSHIGADTLSPVVDQKIYASLSANLYAVNGTSAPVFAYVGEDQYSNISYGLSNSTTYPATINTSLIPVILKPGVTTPESINDIIYDDSRQGVVVTQSQTSKFFKGWYMAKITITANFGHPNYASAYLSCNVYNTTYKPLPLKHGGGIRIKSILYKTSDLKVKNIEYKYNDFENPSKSSGSLVSGIPLFRQKLPTIYRWQDPTKTFYRDPDLRPYRPIDLIPCLFNVISSNNLIQFELTAGGNVGYANVTVKELGNGEVRNYFTSPIDYPDTLVSTFPYTPPTSYEAFRGNLIRKIVLNENSDTVQVTKTGYNYRIIASYPVYRSSFYQIDPRSNPDGTRFSFDTFSDYQNFIYMTTQVNFNTYSPYAPYTNHSNVDIVTRKEYRYLSILKKVTNQITEDFTPTMKIRSLDRKLTYNEINNEVSEQRDISSSGDTLLTKYKYPIDYNTTDLRVRALVNNNIINSTIDVKTIKNNKLISHRQSVFNNDNFLTEIFDRDTQLGLLVEPFDNTNPYTINSKKMEIFYDDYFNVLGYKPESQLQTSFIWGYHSNYPIAEVKGATGLEISATSFEDDSKGYWVYSGEALSSADAVTGKMVYQLSTGSLQRMGLSSLRDYCLSYWSKNSEAFIVNGTYGIPVKTNSANGWNYFVHVIKGVSSVELSGVGLLDQVCLFPSNSQMTSYTYSPITGVTSATDSKGQIIYYDYDDFQRLKYVKDQHGNIVKSYDYHYKP